ncbi:protein ripply3 [Peromyscus maniculatus bairdii]|uniref:protein ripply3 n=1 Tax=Peromyscus maniculatus bairdii TaxID=230844 RepID=UPI00042AC2B4|nr:protein ripply3 [Peromyscus maniculatus bairdii]
MGPEAAAGASEARGRLCHCPGDDPGRPPLPRGPESSVPALWRPWMPLPGDAELTRTGSPCEPCGTQQTLGSKGAFGFQHPVRLYLPLSKRQEYLQSSGEKVLASFPVQATIHFYNDESESDSEEEEEEAQPSHLQSREAEGQGSGPGGKGRAGLASLSEEGWFRGKGQLRAEGSERSSE